LQAVANSENLDLYEVPTIQIFIEYLYMKYKVITLQWRFPVYIAYLVLYLLSIYLHNTVEQRFKSAAAEVNEVEIPQNEPV